MKSPTTLRFLWVLLAIGLMTAPSSVTAAETSPHEIPWIDHKTTLDPGGGVHSLDFGPKGNYFGIDINQEFIIYNRSTYDTVVHISPTDNRSWQESTFGGIEIGPNAEKFYIAAGYQVLDSSEGWIQVHDLKTGEKLREIANHDWDLNSLESGPKRRFLVATDHVDNVVIWDTKKNRYLPELYLSDGHHNLSGADIVYPNPSLLVLSGPKVYELNPSPDQFDWYHYPLNLFPLNFVAGFHSKLYELDNYPHDLSKNGKHLLSMTSSSTSPDNALEGKIVE